MNFTRLSAPFRENYISAVITAALGASVGVTHILVNSHAKLPTLRALIFAAAAGAVCAWIVWILFSAALAKIFHRPIKSARRIEAASLLPLFVYALGVTNVFFHIIYLEHYLVIAAVEFFVAAKIAEIFYMKFPRRSASAVALIAFALASFFICARAKQNVLGKTDFWRDREVVPFSEESPAFKGAGATRVFVNADGDWRPATQIQPPAVYESKKKLERPSRDTPSRLSLSLLTADKGKNGEADLIVLRYGVELYRKKISWNDAGWHEEYIGNGFWTGEISIRVAPKSGKMWIADPVWTSVFPRPNIIVIVMDALRADHLSCYGYPRKTSPVIDKIAASGTIYENHYSVAAWTTSSIGSLFTGLYPRQHGCVDFGSMFMPLEFDTLAEKLQRVGYRTIGISGNPVLSLKTGYAQGFDSFDEGCLDKVNWRSGECMVSRVKKISGGNGPTFIYAHWMDTHSPYIAPPPYLMKWRGTTTPPRENKMLQFISNRYDDTITYGDSQIGEFLAVLESKGLLKNACVIITADHGEELGDHNGFNHGFTVFEEVTHIPLVMSCSGAKQGVKVQGLTSSIDLFNAILQIAGVSAPISNAGTFLPERKGDMADNLGQTALITPEYKLIYDSINKKLLLFDRLADPKDLHNIADLKPEIAAELKDEMENILIEQGKIKPPTKRSNAMLIEMQKRLKALKYTK